MVSQIGSRRPRRPRRALVLGCGGTLGAAWSIATLVEVARALAWDPRTADVIVGTSAGSELAMLLGAGVGVDGLLAAALGERGADPALAHRLAHPPTVPPWPRPRLTDLRGALDRGRPVLARVTALLPEGRGDASFLDALTDAHVTPGDWVAHPATWIVGFDLARGARVAFGSPGAPAVAMRDAVRASWAIPGWLPPVVIGGRRHVDGGVASPTSLDLALAADVDEAIVLAPMCSTAPGRRRGLGKVEGVVRAAMTRTLDAEVAQARARGVRVVRLEPDHRDLAVMGGNFMDPRRRCATLESTLRTARDTVGPACARAGVTAHPETRARTAS